MTHYDIHTIDSAPEASQEVLAAAKKKMGFVPNLMATMAESPVLVESYLTLMALFDKTQLSETERQIILMTNNRLNGCTYCMAAHTAVSKMARVDDEVIDALRSGEAINDPKLEALRQFAEVIVGTSLKVLSNYTTPITKPALDKAFAPVAWNPGMVTAA